MEGGLQKEIDQVRLEIREVESKIEQTEIRLLRAFHRQTHWMIGSVGASLDFMPAPLFMAPARLTAWLRERDIAGWYTVPSLPEVRAAVVVGIDDPAAGQRPAAALNSGAFGHARRNPPGCAGAAAGL